ncbi:hypothetical protein QR680_016777 [Steinernema hermaphroditum]|uniref:Uncharacterized protein n=1 Tax=Steinernema hermaphroditum TaxID=289476 RepID=A0AA39HD88_9BILA|nr:hypothetical protein QR680_016777 [Steinernema hermaphroditum]
MSAASKGHRCVPCTSEGLRSRAEGGFGASDENLMRRRRSIGALKAFEDSETFEFRPFFSLGHASNLSRPAGDPPDPSKGQQLFCSAISGGSVTFSGKELLDHGSMWRERLRINGP